MKKIISTVLSLSLLSVSALSMAACDTRPVLKVASWVDYIDMGGDDSYVKGSKSLDKEFEDWYYEQTGKKIRVDYIPMQDNENMYTKLDITKNTYDLLCPSEYMIMKMAAENLLEKYPESFFDTSIETNYYAKNVSPYIKNIFDNGKTTDGSSWSDYAPVEKSSGKFTVTLEYEDGRAVTLYDGAYDAMRANAAAKAGEFKFTVPADITKTFKVIVAAEDKAMSSEYTLFRID